MLVPVVSTQNEVGGVQNFLIIYEAARINCNARVRFDIIYFDQY